MIRNMNIRENNSDYNQNIGSTLSVDAALAVLKVELEKISGNVDIRILKI